MSTVPNSPQRHPDAWTRLVDDLEAAVDQYDGRAVPVAHIRLILQRFRERLPEPRVVLAYDHTGVFLAADEPGTQLMDVVVNALKTLGCTDRQHGLAVLMTAPATLTEREQRYVLDKLDNRRPKRCDELATVNVEAYSPVDGRAYGRLDEGHYACAEHLEAVERTAASKPWLTLHRLSIEPDARRRCGQVWDYRSQSLREVTR